MGFPNPFFLVVMREADHSSVAIDLDEPGWLTKWESRLHEPGRWVLIRKLDQKVMVAILVFEGEEPYYLARHVGSIGGDGSLEAIAYGIGKRRTDGHMDRLWVLPDWSVCAGDDVDVILERMVKTKLQWAQNLEKEPLASPL